MKKAVSLLVIFLFTAVIWAQNRYALVIGNANYPDAKDRLPNAINDTNDVYEALKKLEYDVVLKQDLKDAEMDKEVDAFIARLKNNRNSEGFFWYAGHAINFEGEGYLLPLDVDMGSETRVIKTSLSVSKLSKKLDEIHNKANVLVLDACRTPPKIENERGRGMGDETYRVITSVPHVAELIVIYSTAPGTIALDSVTGKRNSPFTEAFLKNINAAKPLVNIYSDITRETLSLTNQRQRPYISGSITDGNYSLNPAYLPLPSPNAESIPEGLRYEIVDGKSVTITGYTGNATTLNIPERIQGLPVTVIHRINNSKVSYSLLINNITIPSTVTSIEGALLQLMSLTSINVDNRNNNFASIDGVLFDKNIRTLIAYPASKKDGTYNIPSSVTSIGRYAFCDCKNLTRITIPSSVTSVGEFAFGWCKSLISINIPSSVTSIADYAFVDCSSLTSIIIPSSVTSIGDYVFYACDNLTSITIPSLVTSIGDHAFYDCNSLTSINVDSRNNTYASIDGVLFNKNIRTLITYPKGKKNVTYTIPSTVTTIGNSAFIRHSNLTSITIPSSVTSIGDHAFYDCSSLTSVIIPSSVTSIGDSAFSNCRSLKSITIPSSVTSIGNSAFWGCSSLTSVTLSWRTKVEEYAFPETARIIYSD